MPVLSLLLFAASVTAQDLGCKKFTDIYADGTALCENMWGGAFKVVENVSEAYTMWFFDDVNPNDEISQRLNPDGNTSVCNLQYFHKTLPTPEGDDFTECHPWKEASCCTANVANATNLKISYGEEYHWDRCGTLSPACERFFVQEACFYECSPHIGLYRKYGGSACDAADTQCSTVYNASDSSHNTWQVHQMPIRKDYCDSWLVACANDMFCSADNGDYFSCARVQPTPEPTSFPTMSPTGPTVVENNTSDDSLSGGIIALIVILAVVAVGLVGLMCFVLCREKAGKPLFKPLDENKAGTSMPAHASAADGHRPQAV